MLNVGAGEVIVIALILLIAVGPEQLPGLIRRVGRTVAEVRGMTEGLRSEFMSGLDEIERATDPEAWAAASGPSKVKRRAAAADDGDDHSDSDSDGDSDSDSDSDEIDDHDDHVDDHVDDLESESPDSEVADPDPDTNAKDPELPDPGLPDNGGLNSFLKPSIAYENPITTAAEGDRSITDGGDAVGGEPEDGDTGGKP